MLPPFRIGSVVASFFLLIGCATTPPPPELPGEVIESGNRETPSVVTSDPVVGAAEFVNSVVERKQTERASKTRETKNASRSITIHCTVKLPDDPTDNPELCRSFQIVLVDEAGNESPRFRFAGDARYLFAGKIGKKYRIKPVIGKNWEYTVEPDRELIIGDRAHLRLRQKE